MDGLVHMRISFWAYWLDPLMVAVSKEMCELMRHFPGSYAFGVSSRYMFKMSCAHRTLGVHTSLYPLVRYVIPGLERQFDVSHVYTTLADWHFLNALGRRAIVLTLTSPSQGADTRLLGKLSHVVAQSEHLAESAIQHGIPADRVSIVYPGVDLDLFNAKPPLAPGRVWKCLFASSPENTQEIYTKGVDLLLDLAACEPNLEITILWRPFGRQSDRALQEVLKRRLPNVVLHRGRITDIHRFYGQYHFTVAPFRTVGKSCPNSILESLATGRPVLVSQYVDIAALLAQEGAGLSFEQTLDGLREAFALLCTRYQSFQRNARLCAEKYFNLQNTIQAYKAIYHQVLQYSR
jgi:glycosyltransferase involved in cell wall biosynthesis